MMELCRSSTQSGAGWVELLSLLHGWWIISTLWILTPSCREGLTLEWEGLRLDLISNLILYNWLLNGLLLDHLLCDDGLLNDFLLVGIGKLCIHSNNYK